MGSDNEALRNVDMDQYEIGTTLIRCAPRCTATASIWMLEAFTRFLEPEVPDPALDRDPQPGLAHPLAGPPATSRGLDRALQHHARAHRDFRRAPRFTGALYKASGWIQVGTTQGRGRYDRHTKRDQPRKDIWLQPLRKDWRRTLNR